jgi:hypothetical protein
MNRRIVLLGLGGALVAAPSFSTAAPASSFSPIQIVLSPTCGCCKEWVAHLRQHGFQTGIEEVPEINRRKTAARIPTAFWSCHTGFVDGYFIEGHVPADDVKRLLVERPRARGLAVPGMPVGSPGMEVPNVAADRYKTLLIGLDDKAVVWAEH